MARVDETTASGRTDAFAAWFRNGRSWREATVQPSTAFWRIAVGRRTRRSERVLSGLSPFASPRPSNGEKFTNASERGSRFESPSSVRASGRGFPPCKIRRCHKALARPTSVCGGHLSGFRPPGGESNSSLHVAKFRFPNAGRLGRGWRHRTCWRRSRLRIQSSELRVAFDTISLRSGLGGRLQAECRPLIRPHYRKRHQAFSPKAAGQSTLGRSGRASR